MHKEQFFFVGEELDFTTGPEAETLLETRNDAAYANDRGIVRVPKDRWSMAQVYERNTWMVAGSEATDDRNGYHQSNFDNYVTLRDASFKSAIELGCGPFTNLRMIARHCKIERCNLLDPLINEYLCHKNCVYSRGV